MGFLQSEEEVKEDLIAIFSHLYRVREKMEPDISQWGAEKGKAINKRNSNKIREKYVHSRSGEAEGQVVYKDWNPHSYGFSEVDRTKL